MKIGPICAVNKWKKRLSLTDEERQTKATDGNGTHQPPILCAVVTKTLEDQGAQWTVFSLRELEFTELSETSQAQKNAAPRLLMKSIKASRRAGVATVHQQLEGGWAPREVKGRLGKQWRFCWFLSS